MTRGRPARGKIAEKLSFERSASFNPRPRGRPPTRQGELLDYVRATISRDGVAPSYSMIAKDLDVGTAGEVRKLVCRLEERGLLRRVGRGRVRRIRLMSLA